MEMYKKDFVREELDVEKLLSDGLSPNDVRVLIKARHEESLTDEFKAARSVFGWAWG